MKYLAVSCADSIGCGIQQLLVQYREHVKNHRTQWYMYMYAQVIKCSCKIKIEKRKETLLKIVSRLKTGKSKKIYGTYSF